jgi:hypothetical protein
MSTSGDARADRGVQCKACGQTWPREPALEVLCPTCQAPIGRKCRRPSGYGCDLHAERDREAMRRGIYGPCPAGPSAPAAAETWPFREVSRRKVGGGSKTSPADEITWAGIVGGGPITFTTRPRLVTANASFLVPSNARLRTSILKRDEVHFIDLCVRNRVLREAERAELQALAQAQDPDRPVRVRHTGEPVRGRMPNGVIPHVPPPPPDPGPESPPDQLTLL